MADQDKKQLNELGQHSCNTPGNADFLKKYYEFHEQANKVPKNTCPSCGHCPTCGRSNWPYPTYPTYPGYQPYQNPIVFC